VLLDEREKAHYEEEVRGIAGAENNAGGREEATSGKYRMQGKTKK